MADDEEGTGETAGEEVEEDVVDEERIARFASLDISEATGLHLELDDDKREALRACLQRGRLSITLTEVDLADGGRLQGAYLYD